MKTKQIAQIGILIALQIVITRFLTITTPIFRISFGFLPIAIIAMLYGPIYSAIGAAVGDVIGALFLSALPYYFGYTVSIAIMGLIFGLFLYKKNLTLKRIIVCILITTVVVTLGLNTFWTYLLTGNGFAVLLASRGLQAVIMLPVQVATIYFADKLLYKVDLSSN